MFKTPKNTMQVFLETGTTKKGTKYFYFKPHTFTHDGFIVVVFTKICKPEDDYIGGDIYIQDYDFIPNFKSNNFYLRIKEWHKIKINKFKQEDYQIKDYSLNDFSDVEDYEF